MKAINVLKTCLLTSFLFVLFWGSTASSAHCQNKLVFSTETSISFWVNSWFGRRTVPSMIFMGGYQVNDRFSIGLASGVRLYNIPIFDDPSFYPYIPVSLDLKLLLSKGDNVPFIFGRAGYSIATRTRRPFSPENGPADFKGGFAVTAGLGYRLDFADNRALSFHLAYDGQESQIAQIDNIPFNHFFMVGMGFFMFKSI